MIDENKLIERLQRCVDASDNSNFTNGLLSAIDIVNQQPKIGEWIPCSKRLPEYSGYYLVTYSDTTVHECFYGIRKGEAVGEWEKKYIDNDEDVKAWMDLPEPHPFWENEDE